MSNATPAFPTSYDGMTLAQLEALRDEMNATLKQLERQERQAALQQIHALIAQFSFLPFEVFPRQAAGPAKARLPAKYYDPDTGQSWSGRGKRPRWMQGKDPRQFLIQKEGILAAMADAGVLKDDGAPESGAETPSV